MKKSRFMEKQIAFVLKKQAETGIMIDEVFRKPIFDLRLSLPLIVQLARDHLIRLKRMQLQ